MATEVLMMADHVLYEN